MKTSRPLVLCLSGLDPTGGAGIQADIEAVAAVGGHALPVVTVLTAQDTLNVGWSEPVAPNLLRQQIGMLRADCRIAAVKIGLLGGADQIEAIAEILADLPVPVVCDPVLRAGGGADLATAELIAALRERLLKYVTVLTPNTAEARRLVPHREDPGDCARHLLDAGCANVLITGGDEPTERVLNTWYQARHAPQRFEWPRLPETFHGAGCTLAAAIAALLACGATTATAIEEAQRWTQGTLRCALTVGNGRRIPQRLP